MVSLAFAAMVQVSFLGAQESGFERAYHESLSTGRPLVVLIGADWCPSCLEMKNSIIPQVARDGGLQGVVYTYVDFDRQRKLASQLSRAKSIPQLIRFDQTPFGWRGQLLVGAKSPQEVYSFVNEELPIAAGQQRSAHSTGNKTVSHSAADWGNISRPPEPLAGEAY